MRPAADWLNALRTSFWFLPAVMAAAAAPAAWISTRIDIAWHLADQRTVDALLSTLAGSLITVTGVVFSLTMVTLHLASNQFGPLLLRSFMRDRGHQLVLGTFVATFVYCVTALAWHAPPGSLAVPGALVLTAASVAMLIFFIHHLAMAIQADTLVDKIAEQLATQVEAMYPRDEPPAPSDHPGPVRCTADQEGFVVAVDVQRLKAIAAKYGASVHVLAAPGRFVVRGDGLVASDADVPAQELRSALTLSGRRTEEEDIAFGIQQLTQMAVRALSPGINDPFTANAGIDRLCSTYIELVQRGDGARAFPAGTGTLILERPRFAELLQAGYGVLRQHARTPLVQGRLLERCRQISAFTLEPGRRQALQEQMDAMVKLVESSGHPDVDTQRLVAMARLAVP